MKLRALLTEMEQQQNQDAVRKMSPEQKKTMMEMIANYNEFGKQLRREGSLCDIAKRLSEIAAHAETMAMNETDDWFDKKTVSRNMEGLKKSCAEFDKLAKEAQSYQQRMEALYEEMGFTLNRYFDIKDPVETPAAKPEEKKV
jgi:Zn-dependent oligopeptidase